MKRFGNDARTRLPGSQAGQALLILLALLTVIMVAASVTAARGTQQSTSFRDAQTQAALNAAKQALVSLCRRRHVVDRQPSAPRRAALPGPQQRWYCRHTMLLRRTSRLGRLPWKTSGLPDLRDGSGERLWYAVSLSFVNNPRTGPCTVPADTGCLNSNTSGTITVRDQSGTVMNDGTAPATAAIAVVIAPGSALTRLRRNRAGPQLHWRRQHGELPSEEHLHRSEHRSVQADQLPRYLALDPWRRQRDYFTLDPTRWVHHRADLGCEQRRAAQRCCYGRELCRPHAYRSATSRHRR